jgi:hypothetical protein
MQVAPGWRTGMVLGLLLIVPVCGPAGAGEAPAGVAGAAAGALDPATRAMDAATGAATPPIGAVGTAPPAQEVPAVNPDSIVVFPTVKGSNLEGKDYVLPRDLEGRCNLLFIAFLREQQEMVDTWMPAARYLSGAYPELRYYELPTIARLNSVTRWFINKGMAGGIPDPAARAATITLYIDKEPFRRALGIESEQTITVLLLDDRDRVVWRTEGPRTDAKTQELNQAVHHALHQSDAPSGGQPR